jgi:hypothetical protein
MSFKRAAAYIVGGSLALTWLASAAGVRQHVEVPPRQTPVETTGTETLAADVQAQTERLKQRMAVAPVPQEPLRNPFSFASRERPRAQARREPAPVDPPPMPPMSVEPALELVGVAEHQSPQGLVRTAIISTLGEELFLVKEGETVAARYRVKAVGADAVELTDLVTGGIRRLILRDQSAQR